MQSLRFLVLIHFRALRYTFQLGTSSEMLNRLTSLCLLNRLMGLDGMYCWARDYTCWLNAGSRTLTLLVCLCSSNRLWRNRDIGQHALRDLKILHGRSCFGFPVILSVGFVREYIAENLFHDVVLASFWLNQITNTLYIKRIWITVSPHRWVYNVYDKAEELSDSTFHSMGLYIQWIGSAIEW